MIIIDTPGQKTYELKTPGEKIEILRIIKRSGTYDLKIILHAEKTEAKIRTFYLAREKASLNINDEIIHYGKNTRSDNLAKGAIYENGAKHFSQKIVFKNGCSGAIGHEKEEIILLGKKLANVSVPIIICDENDVEGSHAVTAGELDENMLYYMKTRGLSESAAKKLIINSLFKDLKQNESR